MTTLLHWLWIALEVISVPVVGGVAAAVVLIVGIPGLAVWAGWSRNRDLERRDWKGVSRW